MRPLLSFCAIFKDEAPTVAKTLESVKPFVDQWTVVDTGSFDGTQTIVQKTLGDIPGTLWSHPFVDYATTRNKVLEYEQCASMFSIMLSADETLEGGETLRAFLEAHRDAPDGAYCITMQTGTRTWPSARILRTDAGWCYVGKIHERPVGPKGEVLGPIIPGVKIVHTPSDPERKDKRLREYDLPLLQKEVDDDTKSLEERAHAIFFLAETHAVLAAGCPRIENRFSPKAPGLLHQMTAMALYFRYAQIASETDSPAHDFNKSAYALSIYFQLAAQAGIYTSEEMVSRLKPLVAAAPTLAEARYLLAEQAAYGDVRDGLFLAIEAADVARTAKENPTYDATDTRLEWLSLRIAAQCAKQLEKNGQARDLAERGIAAGGPKEVFGAYL